MRSFHDSNSPIIRTIKFSSLNPKPGDLLYWDNKTGLKEIYLVLNKTDLLILNGNPSMKMKILPFEYMHSNIEFLTIIRK